VREPILPIAAACINGSFIAISHRHEKLSAIG
jgi:hypothetical protein